MKVKDLKALARETLLKWYGSVIIARFFKEILVFLSILTGLLFLGIGLLNVGMFEDMIRIIEPDFVPSKAAAVIFIMLFLGTMGFTVILDVWLTFGYGRMLLNICRGRQASSGDILAAFKKEARPWKTLWVCILRVILIAAAVIVPLFVNGCAIVCGYDSAEASWIDPWRITIRSLQILAVMWMFYLSLGLSFAHVAVIDRPETGVADALKLSLKTVTGGRKPKLFWLMTFSFLFWLILAAVVPLASLWIMPYIEVTMILYYLDGLGELKELPAYAELLKKREEEAAAEAENKPEAAEEIPEAAEAPAAEAAQPKTQPEMKPETQPEAPAAEPAQPAVQPAEEEPSAEEMNAIPRKISFPDFEADPNRKPAQPGTEE